MLFVTVILAVTDERNEHPALAPLAIGLTLAAIHFVAIPATGTSVNPARSIGPALFAGPDAIVQLWLFILAPLLGGAIAGSPTRCSSAGAATPVPGLRPALRRRGRGARSWLRRSRPVPAAVEPGDDGSATASYGIAPIVQDGWQWDPVGQQWHPVGADAGAVARPSRPPGAGRGRRARARAGTRSPQDEDPAGRPRSARRQ